jgi:hypothetical protein
VVAVPRAVEVYLADHEVAPRRSLSSSAVMSQRPRRGCRAARRPFRDHRGSGVGGPTGADGAFGASQGPRDHGHDYVVGPDTLIRDAVRPGWTCCRAAAELDIGSAS